MANVNGTMGASPAPALARVKQIADFFRTGSTTPTQATPTLRASSTGSLTNTTSSLNITIPSAAVVGDTMFIFFQQSTNANPNSSPPGFSQCWTSASSGGSLCVFYKVLVTGDPGATITWSGLSASGTTVGWACYSNVDPAVPISCVSNNVNTSLVSTSTTTSFTTASAQVVLEAFGCWFGSTGGTISGISAGTNVLTVQPGGSNTSGGLIINQINQASAGLVGGDTCTVTGTTSRFNGFLIALNGAPTGGTALTCCSFVDSYATYVGASSQSVWTVWKWPGTSNNAHSDFFVVFGGNPSLGQTTMTFYACEVYNTSNHTWNALMLNFQNNNFTFPNGGPLATTTPPWAFVNASPAVVGTTQSGVLAPTDAVSTGSSTYLLVANNDGFFYSSTNGGTFSDSLYFGAFTSLVANPNITDSVPLCAMTWGSSGTTTGAASREPGYNWNQNSAFGDYIADPFYPTLGSGITSFFGLLNGNMVPNDLFQAPPNQPLCCRWALTRASTFWASQGNLVGTLRGLLPSWIKYLLSSGCAWGDTTTDAINSDNLFFAGTNAANTDCWIDTTVA